MLIFAPKKMQYGFAMLEVMITAFVLCFGVLALAAVQVKTLGLTRNTSVRSDVAMQAEALAESIRANPIRFSSAGKLAWKLDHYKTQNISGAINPVPVCESSNIACTQGQLAASDLYLFHKNLRAVFPVDKDVFSQVCYTSDFTNPTPDDMGCNGVGSQMAIKIAWRTKASQHEAQLASGQAVKYINSGYVLKVGDGQ